MKQVKISVYNTFNEILYYDKIFEAKTKKGVTRMGSNWLKNILEGCPYDKEINGNNWIIRMKQ